MKVIIKNIPPIESTEIITNDLTVIVGMNNTGKSLIMHAAHALYNETLNYKILKKFFYNNSYMRETIYKDLLKKRVHTFEFSQEGILTICVQIMEFYKTTETANILSKYIFNDKIEYESIIIGRDFSTNDDFNSVFYNFSYLTESAGSKDSIIIEKAKGTSQINISINNEYVKKNYSFLMKDEIEILNEISDFFARLFSQLKIFSRKTIPFPSERSGLLYARHSLTEYPNAMTKEYIDFINQEINTKEESEQKFLEIATFIENTILFGEIKIDPNGNMYFLDKKTKSHISMSRVSSSVRELSGIVLYLKYSAKSGDTLLIDEPELSLHPNAIRNLVRAVSLMIKVKLKIFIITHSDYFIKELNNLINLNSIKNINDYPQLLDFYDLTLLEKLKLDKEKVSLYSFNRMENENVKITGPITCEEYGFYEPLFDKIILSLNQSEELIYDIKNGIVK